MKKLPGKRAWSPLCLIASAVLLSFLLPSGFSPRSDEDFMEPSAVPGALAAAEVSEGLKNFFILKKLHWYWENGPSYTKRVYRRDLQVFLTELLGRPIETDHSYIIQSPGDLRDKKVQCNLIDCRWLYFYGPVDVDHLKDIVKNDPLLLKKWWRSGYLFSLSGKVKKYRFGRDIFGETVEIVLDKIVVRASDKK